MLRNKWKQKFYCAALPMNKAMAQKMSIVLYCAFLSALMGYCSLWMAWAHLYGIKRDVITTEIYSQYESVMGPYGAIIGAALGLLCGLFLKRPFAVLLSAYPLTLFIYLLTPAISWQFSLAKLTLLMAISGGALGWVFRREAKRSWCE